MTPQENDALRILLSQLIQIRGIVKDPEADAMIGRAVSQQPDAAYLLVQRTLILEQALESAKAQISQLQQQVRSAQGPSGNASFLNDNAWGNSAGMNAPAPQRPQPQTEYSVTGQPLPSAPYASAPTNYPGYQASAPGSRIFGAGGGGGSMLGTLAATAAGVAGGAFLFQGIENLLGNLHHPHAASGLADVPSAFRSDDAFDSRSLSSDPSSDLSSDVSRRLESIDNPFSDTSDSTGSTDSSDSSDSSDWSADSGSDDDSYA